MYHNAKWKYIHRVRYVDEDLEFPKVFVLIINVLSIQQQEKGGKNKKKTLTLISFAKFKNIIYMCTNVFIS